MQDNRMSNILKQKVLKDVRKGLNRDKKIFFDCHSEEIMEDFEKIGYSHNEIKIIKELEIEEEVLTFTKSRNWQQLHKTYRKIYKLVDVLKEHYKRPLVKKDMIIIRSFVCKHNLVDFNGYYNKDYITFNSCRDIEIKLDIEDINYMLGF